MFLIGVLISNMINRYVKGCVILYLILAVSTAAMAHNEVLIDFESLWNQELPAEENLDQVNQYILINRDAQNHSLVPYAQAGLLKAQQDSLPEMVATFELTLGALYSTIDLQDSSLLYLNSALEQVESLGLQAEIARANKELSWLYTYIPDFDAALAHGHSALDKYQELEQEEEAAFMKSRIAYILMRMGQYEQAFPLLQEAEAALQAFNNPKELGYTYMRLATYYQSIQDTSQTTHAFNAYVDEMKAFPPKIFLPGAYMRRGGYLREIKAYEKAEQDLLLGMEIVGGHNGSLYKLLLQNELGSLYVEMGRFEEATAMLEAAIGQLPTLMAEPGAIIDVDFEELYKTTAEAYAGMGQYDKAYLYQSMHKALADSMFTAEANRNIIEMQTKYETEKKEALLGQKERQLYLTLGFVLLLLLMGAALFWAYQGKQKQNVLLEQRNEEKAFLIKEIHHRVKNNLQVLSSLLYLQADYIADPNALDAVMEGHNRVQSMGLIHEKLYMGDNLAAVDMNAFVEDLSENLLMTFGMEDQVEVLVDSSIPRLDVDTAIPLALIINELITNSFKYAFPKGREGKVSIRLWINEADELCLEVADDGVGNAAEVLPEQSTSFGKDLVNMLRQKLEGSIENDDSNGYKTLIRCKKYK